MRFAVNFLLLSLAYIICVSPGHSEANSEIGFAPTWNLLSYQEKQQFISGYIHSAGDLQSVLAITIQYLKDNPDKAIEGLEQLRSLYDYSQIQPEQLTKEIDEFYKDPSHHSAPLTKAVTYARYNHSR